MKPEAKYIAVSCSWNNDTTKYLCAGATASSVTPLSNITSAKPIMMKIQTTPAQWLAYKSNPSSLYWTNTTQTGWGAFVSYFSTYYSVNVSNWATDLTNYWTNCIKNIFGYYWTQCPSGYILDACNKNCLADQRIVKMPDNWVKINDAGSCILWVNSTYFINSSSQCQLKCSKVNTLTNGTWINWDSGYLFNGTWVDSCPSGTTINTVSNKCDAGCTSNNCARWAFDANLNSVCVNCNTEYWEVNCPANKPVQYLDTSNTIHCIAASECPSYGFIQNQTVTNSKGTTSTQQICRICSSSLCTSWQPSLDSIGISCHSWQNDMFGHQTINYLDGCKSICPAYYFYSGIQWMMCPNSGNNYKNSNKYGEGCLECQYDSVYQMHLCSRWDTGYYLLNGDCVKQCTGVRQFYVVNSDGSNTWVNICPDGYYANSSGKWVQKWPSGTFLDSTSKKWVNCGDKIQDCQQCSQKSTTSITITSLEWAKWGTTRPYLSNDKLSWAVKWPNRQVPLIATDFKICLKCPENWQTWNLYQGLIPSWTLWDDGYFNAGVGSFNLWVASCPYGTVQDNGKWAINCSTSNQGPDLSNNKICRTWKNPGCLSCPNNYKTCTQWDSGLYLYSLISNKFPSEDMGWSNAWNDQYTCMSSGSWIVTPDRSYRNSTNQCAVCPDYTSKWTYSNGTIQALGWDYGYWYSNTTQTWQDPRASSQVYMNQYDNLAQSYRDIWINKCPSGYVIGPLNKWISWNSNLYSQCSTTNWLKWDLISTFWESNIPSWIKCATGYKLNDNGCSVTCPLTSIVRGNNQNQYCYDCPDNQIPVNNTWTDCSTVIPNWVNCGNNGVATFWNQWGDGYQVNTTNTSQCVASTWGLTYLKSDGSGCAISWNSGEYQNNILKKWAIWSIKNWREWIGTYSGSPICTSWGVSQSSNGTNLPYYLSVDRDACLSSWHSGQIPDSKNNCVEGPSNANTFKIVTEIDWGLAKYIQKNYLDGWGDILNATSCNSGYYLMQKLNTNENLYFWGQWQTGWYYDANTLQWIQCGNYCLSCSTTNLGSWDKCDPEENTMTFNGKCYKNWPKGSYKSETSWIACDSSCASCTGPSSSECTSCPINSSGDYASYLFVDNQQQTQKCLITCPTNFVISSNGKCVQVSQTSLVASTLCTSDWLQWTTSSTTQSPKCTSCSNGYVPNGIGCQKICDSSQYAIDDWITCPNRVECLNCPSKSGFANKLNLSGNCVYTAWPGSSCNEWIFVNKNTDIERVACTSCNGNTVIDNNGLCTTMLISANSKCAMINWQTCDDDNQKWMKCADGFVISTAYQCITECPRGQKLIGDRCSPWLNSNYESWYNKDNSASNSEKALSWKQGFYLLNGDWVAYCPDRFFGDELTRWWVRWSCDWSTWNSFINNCENLCITGYVWSSSSQKCVERSPSISSTFFNIKNKCLTINLPTNVKLLKLPSTGFNFDNFISGYTMWGDSSMNENWLNLFSTDASIQNLLKALLSPLNANEKKELMYLYNDLPNRVATMNTNGTFNLTNYDMTQENQFVPIKLLGLYKSWILGNVDLTENLSWTLTDFISTDDGLNQQWSDIFSQGFIQWLSNFINQCSYEVKNDRLLVEIWMEDLSFLQGGLEIPLTDALYYVSENQLLPSAIQSVSIPDIIDFADILPDLLMPNEISQCEPFAIDFINSKGLGSQPIIEAALNLAEDIATGEITYEIQNLIKDKFSQLFNSQISSAIQNGASKIDFDKYALGFLAGNKVNMSFNFTSSSSGQSKMIEKNLVITNNNVIRLTVPNSISLNPNKVTYISPNATYYSCLSTDPLLNQTISLNCYVDYFDSKNVLTTSIIPKWALNNTEFTFSKIVEIRVKATLGTYSSSVKIGFTVEGSTCTCDLSQLDGMIEQDFQFKIDKSWLICPANIVPFYYLSTSYGSTTLKFQLTDLTPKIISYLPKNQEIDIKLVITDATGTVEYGSCSRYVKVNDLQAPIITKIVPKYYQGIQEVMRFDVTTLGFTGETILTNLTFKLNVYGSSTNLVSTRKDKISISKNSITICPGVIQAGTKYILDVVSTRDIWKGEDSLIIYPTTSNYFNAQLLNTGQFNNGDKIGIKISKAYTFSQGINCYLGTMKDSQFSVSNIIGQVTTSDVTTDFIVPYLTLNKVVDYQIAIKWEFNSGTDINSKSPDIKSLYIKVLTSQATPISTQSQSSKILTPSTIMTAISSAYSSISIYSTINSCISLASSTVDLWNISNDVFSNCYTALQSIIATLGLNNLLNLIDMSLLNKILTYIEKSFIWYINDLTSRTTLTDTENTVLNTILDANYKLLFSYADTTNNTVIWNILSTNEGIEKLKLFDSLISSLSGFTLTSDTNSKIQLLKKLILCTNAANVQVGGVISDQSSSSAYSVYSTTVFDVGSTYTAQAQTARRNLDSSNSIINYDKCQATVMQVPTNLKSSYDILFEVEYQQNWKLPQGDSCDLKQSDFTMKDCWVYHISSRILNTNSTAIYQNLNITSDLNGSLSLNMPNDFVKNKAACAYYDNGCWKMDGIQQNSDGTCTTSHLSTFAVIDSLIQPISAGSGGQSKSSSTSIVDSNNRVGILTNSFLYIIIVIDICLVMTLFISNRKIMQKEKIGKTKVVNKKEMGYQKTVNDPNAEQPNNQNQVEVISKAQHDKEFKIDESGFPMKEDLGNLYEPHHKKFTKYIGRTKDDGFTNLEKVGKENPSEVYNVAEGEVEELESTSFFGLYKITLPMKHKLLSPFYINHPFLSRFSRFMIMSAVLTICWIIPTVLITNMNIGVVVCISLFIGFILARLITILLEVLFNKRNSKFIKIPSHIIAALIVICFQVTIILASGNLKTSKHIILLVIWFIIALLDLVVYEFTSHFIQVYVWQKIRNGHECKLKFLNLLICSLFY